MSDNVNIIVQDTINDIVVNTAVVVETIDINVQVAVDEVNIIANPNNYVVNINRIIGEQVQSDWDQNDDQEPDYIKNKPSIPSIAGLATVVYVDQQDNLKVDKVAGKGLSENDFTNTLKTKLDGIESGAQVNVNADWNATSGDAEILNKPTIPAAQVNSDWNATSGVEEILNKPSIPTLTSDLTNDGEDGINPFITANDVTPQVNSDWDATSGVEEILNKPTIPSIDGLATVVYVDQQDNLKVDKVAGSRLITSAESTLLGNTSGTNTGDQDLSGLTPNTRSISTTTPLQGGGDLSANKTFSILQSNATQSGFLSNTDWNTFNGKFNLPSFTSGSVLFSNGTTIAQDNAQLFWDNTNKRLGIGTITPTAKLTIKTPGALSTDIALRVRNSADNGDLLLVNGLGTLVVKGSQQRISFNSSEIYIGLGATNNAIGVNGSNRLFIGSEGDFPIYSLANGTVIISDLANPTSSASAKLRVDSTTQGFLPPRMTTAQKNAIASPATGLVVYDTDLQSLANYNGASWINPVQSLLNVAPNVAVTGIVVETLMHTYFMPANTIPINSVINLKCRLSKSGAVGTGTVRLRINTINDFATATSIGFYTLGTTINAAIFVRNINFTSGAMAMASPASSLLSDEIAASTTETGFVFSASTNLYFFISGTNTALYDSLILRSIKITN